MKFRTIAKILGFGLIGSVTLFALYLFNDFRAVIFLVAILVFMCILSLITWLVAQNQGRKSVVNSSLTIMFGSLLSFSPFLVMTVVGTAKQEFAKYNCRKVPVLIERYQQSSGAPPSTLKELEIDFEYKVFSYSPDTTSGYYELSFWLNNSEIYSYDSTNDNWEIENFD